METVDSNVIGKDVFLRLLTTQLKHQDPLAPTGSTEFVAQLAQFTQLEQTANTNETLETLVQSNVSLNNYSAAGLLGKEVQVEGDSVSLFPDTDAEINYRLDANAKNVVIQISNASGEIVRTLQHGAQKPGSNHITWDGRDQYGNVLSDGEYQFDVSALDLQGGPVQSTTFSNGTVSGLVYENERPYLIVNGSKVLASQVTAINN